MQIHGLDTEAALASLKTTAAGLSASEALRRRAEFGPNHVEELGRESVLLSFAREFTHFFALILWVGAGLAFLADHFDPGQGMARLGVAIVGVILVNGIFSFWQEYKAERAVAALRQLLPQKVQALRAGEIVEVLAIDLVPGDIVLLEEGNAVPADCRLIEAFGLRVNTATVTGESLPKARNAESSTEDSALYAKNVLLAGTSVVSGQARAVVYATGMRTEFGRIAQLTQTAGKQASPLQREIARLSHIVAALATGMGVTLFFVGQAMGLPTWANLLFAIGIIVANVPEGLLPTVTLSLAMATQRMAKRNALVRHLPAVEALGSTTTICCDKTGTLTQNRMSVQRLWLGGGFLDSGDLAARPHLTADHRQLFINAALCHSLREINEDGQRKLLGDPMEVALAGMGRQVAGELADHERLDEIPFDTERKRMSVLCVTPHGRMLYCKGAPETVLAACDFVRFDAGTVPLDPAAKTRLLAAQQQMTEAGLRVLAFAHGAVEDGMPSEERGLTLSGLVGLEDPPREEVPDAVARCIAAGIRVIMITGDHPQTGLAIARQIGLVTSERPVVITGDQLRSISAAQLQLALDAKEILFARVAAEQKMLIVQALKAKGEIVAVTGDGVNDAPALKAADIGIAMGIAGTDVAKEAADLILLDDNFASIVAAIEEGRAVFENIRKFLTYILSSNIPGAGALPGFRLVPDSAAADDHPDPGGRSGHRHAAGLGTGRREARSRRDAPPAKGAHGAPAVVGPDGTRLPVSWHASGRGVHGRVLLRARRGGLAVRDQPRPKRFAVSAGNIRLPRDDRGDADDECLSVPPPAEVIAVVRVVQQPVHPGGAGSRAGADPVHHLHPGRQLAIRHSPGRRRSVAAGACRCSVDVGT